MFLLYPFLLDVFDINKYSPTLSLTHVVYLYQTGLLGVLTTNLLSLNLYRSYIEKFTAQF